MKLPNGLSLFVADVIDEETGLQEFLSVVNADRESALQMFIEWANESWRKYSYYFYEADDDAVDDFVEWHDGEDIKAGIYDK